ncbi:MAG: DUF1553 domain-containing protein [Planctomycetota bacterium]
MSRIALRVAERSFLLLLVSLPLAARCVFADEREDFFERQIRPLLVEHCLDCHSEETELSGNLGLDSAEGWRTGGDLGPAIVAGAPNESLLIKAVRYDDRDLQMPPEGKLPRAAIDAFSKWIESGAVDPRKPPTTSRPKQTGLSVEESRQHWAYRPLRSVFSHDSIDAFIEAKHHELGLMPEQPASRRVLIRRLFFDLTGLPPSGDDIRAFEQDRSPDAYERLVDRLLGSPSYGEHLARRWLDVARYAESITLRGFVLADAWRYRDYVIEAFNSDRPFSDMIRDQIAGDLIDHEILADRQMSCVATGFLALANTNLEDQDKTKLEFDHIDEQLTTIGRAFLGQTIGCARCHDHKFDPIPAKDYYSLAAIFRSTVAFEHDNLSKWIRNPLPLGAEEESEFAGAQRELDELTPRLEEINQTLGKLQKQKNEETSEIVAIREEKSHLDAQRRKLQSKLSKRPMYISITEGEPVDALEIRIRGETHQLGEPVSRGFLTAFGAAAEHARRIPTDQSGRLQLAEWIADDRNPLTPRVYTNRVWSWMLGEGLVATENNFGTTGLKPSHPELLDWLTTEFVRGGWSTKRLVRMIVVSEAYRRRSDSTAEAATDAANKWLWRANRKRLPVEAMRDTMSFLSGDLDLVMGGCEIHDGTKSDYQYPHRSNRRSIYWPVFRNSPPPLYTVFDFANSSVSVGERAESTVATQALAIANHPWVIEQAEKAASRHSNSAAHETIVEDLFESCLGRTPTAEELAASLAFLQEEGNAELPSHRTLAVLVHSLFASIDFRYVD